MTNVLVITALHLAALSHIESRGNDAAVGKAGEVTRYQICPKLWKESLLGFKTLVARPQDDRVARLVASDIWHKRVIAFTLKHNRQPDLEELYLLWHRPARVLKPKPVERKRARAFAEVYRKIENIVHDQAAAAVISGKTKE